MTEAIFQFPQLSLDLPNTRMSIDFSKITTDFGRNSNVRAGAQDLPSRANAYRDHSHGATPPRLYSLEKPLPQIKEDVAPSGKEPGVVSLSRQGSFRWPWKSAQSDSALRSTTPHPGLSRTPSNLSSASTFSTATTSTFSATSSSSTRTSYTSSPPNSRPLSTYTEESATLLSLPISILEHIVSYVLCLPMVVAVAPDHVDNRHLQYRYYRAGLDYVDLRSVLKHPLFLVSHHLRNVGLDVFYSKAEFVIDLHSIYHTRVASTINDNLKRHQKFWLSKLPTTVRNTLQNLSKLHIRLPVPSTEAGVRKGRDEDEWMDGSDGKGGGGWRIKSMKKEQEDAQAILKCLERIVDILMTVREPITKPKLLTRSLSNSSSFARSRSIRSQRSQSAHYVKSDVESMGNEQPRSLKRLEVVLVKRSSGALVLGESLSLIRALRSVPVTGFTRYFFELNGQKMVWATKYRKRWQGLVPDGPVLLNDLQQLTVAETPIEPIRTPTEFKFVKLDKRGQLRLLDSAIPKTPITIEPLAVQQDTVPPLPTKLPPSVRRKPLAQAAPPRKRVDSFAFIMDEGITELGSSGTETSGRVAPPTIDELRKIVEDIKAGVY